ncbi:amino acid ABC transporter permease [Exiguobacterium antarcticum]|uniref:amino acid ABC transporter permease n=1 Tax=Exiguobacterium antarcticum TaxID=132920 RepID=UPI000285E692|nr:amino acid ABC transporter permease [Exiguobacterium antarcticum]AFS70691.1 Amino-acid ABC transporter permease protein yckA [Exiguobacterium antarcticum B7]
MNVLPDIDWQSVFNPDLAIEAFPYILGGLGHTLWISLLSMLIGLGLGLLLALARLSRSRLLRITATLYISFMRGVPILVILFMLYFGLPVINIQLDAITAAIAGFSLNSAAYMAEIIRSSILSIDRGQQEAAESLGLSRYRILAGIILPQAVRLAIPPLSNVLLDLVKASSLAAMITVPEIFQRAKIVGGREFDYMTVYFVIAFIYWGICAIIATVQEVLERHFARYV